ncbi:hypothetical protein C8R43DRAFT_947497 [Mycena crocata]|nr:hypothetical protein C8R43DRAFT_947497 [Mycena crocata]
MAVTVTGLSRQLPAATSMPVADRIEGEQFRKLNTESTLDASILTRDSVIRGRAQRPRPYNHPAMEERCTTPQWRRWSATQHEPLTEFASMCLIDAVASVFGLFLKLNLGLPASATKVDRLIERQRFIYGAFPVWWQRLLDVDQGPSRQRDWGYASLSADMSNSVNPHTLASWSDVLLDWWQTGNTGGGHPLKAAISTRCRRGIEVDENGTEEKDLNETACIRRVGERTINAREYRASEIYVVPDMNQERERGPHVTRGVQSSDEAYGVWNGERGEIESR